MNIYETMCITGLKKFKRQVTVEEKKERRRNSEARADSLPSSSDDEEDIDCMRDDLESTKSQLADEIKNSQHLKREKKVLMIDVEALQNEIKNLKKQLKEAGIQEKPMVNGEEGILPKLSKSMSKLRVSESQRINPKELDNLEGDIAELNGQLEAQKMKSDRFEVSVDELEQKLIVSESTATEWESRAVFFEKKYKSLQKDNPEIPMMTMEGTQTEAEYFNLTDQNLAVPDPKLDSFIQTAKRSASRKSIVSQMSRMESFCEGDNEDPESSSDEESVIMIYETESEEESEEENSDSDVEITEEQYARKAEKEAKRIARETEMWTNKFEHVISKENNVRTERNNLRDRIKKCYRDMHNERLEYLKTKAELDEIIKGLNQPTSDDDESALESEEEEEEEDHAEPGWWFDRPNLKPKKLKKKKKNAIEIFVDGEDKGEDLEDVSQFEEPDWSDTEGEESEKEDEDDLPQVKLNFLQSRSKLHEAKMLRVKKETYTLKTEMDQCREKITKEKLRRRRLDEELNMLLSDMQ